MDSVVELSVERIGAQGDGIAFLGGQQVFLPFTAPGDRVRARLGEARAGGHEGTVLDRLVSGPGRADPPCRHFGTCGGCALQHLDPERYRAAKLASLTTALERVRIDPGLVEPLRVVPPARRRARIGFTRPQDPCLPPRVGFRRRFRHDLIDVAECPVLEPALFALIGNLRRLVPEILPLGGAAEAALTATDSGVELLIEAAEPPALTALEACAEFARDCDLARVVWRARQDEVPVVERRPVRVMLSGIAVPFPPGAFLQASRAAETMLVEEVLAAIGDREPVLDLYAGLGTFTFALARTSRRVHAVEGAPRAAATLALAAAGQDRVSVERRDLAQDPLPRESLERYAAVVFDPPRAGALPQALALAASAVETVVAVSCNPATFARDAAVLIAGGFYLERVVPIDQFVWTPHLEVVATFNR